MHLLKNNCFETKPAMLLFWHQPRIVAYLQATFTFVKSSHLRIELHLRMLRRSLRRWCRSSDDELHLRRLHLRSLFCGGGAGAQMMSSAADGSAGFGWLGGIPHSHRLELLARKAMVASIPS